MLSSSSNTCTAVLYSEYKIYFVLDVLYCTVLYVFEYRIINLVEYYLHVIKYINNSNFWKRHSRCALAWQRILQRSVLLIPILMFHEERQLLLERRHRPGQSQRGRALALGQHLQVALATALGLLEACSELGFKRLDL